jgi:hypothetical protein
VIRESVKFKTPELKERTPHLCTEALDILDSMAEYCEERKLPFVVTDSVSTAAEDRELERVSDEHRQGRAFDIRIHDWPKSEADSFIMSFEKKFISRAAVSKVTGHPRLIFRHDNGHGDHLHVQVARLYALKDPLGKDRNRTA